MKWENGIIITKFETGCRYRYFESYIKVWEIEKKPTLCQKMKQYASFTHLPFVSIVVAAYNSEVYIEKCLDSVLKLNYPQFEVIVVDGGSIDDTIHKIKLKIRTNQDKIRLICNKNLGVSADRNVGIEASRGKYIFLLDADTLVEKDSAKELAQLMDADSKIGIAQPKILSLNGRKICNAGTQMDHYGWTFAAGTGENRWKYESPRELICADTTAVLVRKSILEKTGLFDEYFFYYYEATDLSYRIVVSGSKIVYWPKAVVRHKSGHVRKKKTLSWRLFSFNLYHLAFIVKNYKLKEIARFGFPVFLATVLSSLYFLLKRKADVAISILKSTTVLVKEFKTIWSKHLFVSYRIRNTNGSNTSVPFSKSLWNLVMHDLKSLE